MRRRVIGLVLLSTLAVVPAQAGFRDIARALDARLGNRTWIPFLGVARMAVWVVSPKGVHDFQLALWEDKSREIDGLEIDRIVQNGIGQGYTPLVRVRSNRSGEHVFVYAKPIRGNVVELFVLAHERDETVLVRVTADAAVVARDFTQPRRVTRLAQR
jgi:hypothetical protein